MKNTEYHSNWQNNRIKFLVDTYGPGFFENKKILELGSYNGYIGNYFREIYGAKVFSVEGRADNSKQIKENYPELSVITYDLDTPDWAFSKFDIIINFGLFYHLHNHHKSHLVNCIKNCTIMFFETVTFDSDVNELFFRREEGFDQSLSYYGGTPSTSFVENIFNEQQCKFQKIVDGKLNGDGHTYDWPDLNSKVYIDNARRFWIVNNP
jgi:cyclopropane fatty-acyl-phospholipid synthase-like methyltransferase